MEGHIFQNSFASQIDPHAEKGDIKLDGKEKEETRHIKKELNES